MMARHASPSPSPSGFFDLTPGTPAFHDLLYAAFPRQSGEPLLKGYFPRLCRMTAFHKAGIGPQRLKDLWYGSYGKAVDDFSPQERALFFSLFSSSASGSSAPSSASLQNHLQKHIDTLKGAGEDALQKQRQQDEKLLQGIRLLLGVLEDRLSQTL